jgi:hypothetical protein
MLVALALDNGNEQALLSIHGLLLICFLDIKKGDKNSIVTSYNR